MKLATFSHQGRQSFGFIEHELLYDLAPALPDIPDLKTLLVASGGSPASYLNDQAEIRSVFLRLAEVNLLAPIPKPDKYLGLGGNYASHRAEGAAAALAEKYGQIWFNKQISCVTGPYADVWMPKVSIELDYEGELGVVIGRACQGVAAADAFDHVAGFVVCNDISVRDWQARSPTHSLGKSFDTHGPFGPWIVTSDEIGPAPDLALRTIVNGEVRQDARTSDMITGIAEMIEELSTACTLMPGDILATGTPSGVGKGFSPSRYLKPGDVVRVEIEGLGYIENRIVEHP